MKKTLELLAKFIISPDMTLQPVSHWQSQWTNTHQWSKQLIWIKVKHILKVWSMPHNIMVTVVTFCTNYDYINNFTDIRTLKQDSKFRVSVKHLMQWILSRYIYVCYRKLLPSVIEQALQKCTCSITTKTDTYYLPDC